MTRVNIIYMCSSLAKSVAHLTADLGVMSSNLSLNTILEIDHEIVSTAILPLPLIQEGQLSVTDESMCAGTSEQLGGLSLPRNSVNRFTGCA